MKSLIYAFLKFWNDLTAIRRGRVGRRIARRAYGKVTGRFAGRLFK